MISALEQFRPKLPPRARVRTRSDDTGAVHDPATGRCAEVAADQVSLLTLIDGERSLKELADAHYAIHRFVPFTALRDLLKTLARRGLLANAPTELSPLGLLPERAGPLERDAQVIATIPLLIPRVATLLLAAGWTAAVLWLLLTGRPAELAAADPLWFVAGIIAALCGRDLYRASAAAMWGAPPERLLIKARFFIPFAAPDASGLVLLDRRRRAWAYIAGLVGGASVLTLGAHSSGAAFGALAVLVADLCPFLPTTGGRLLATLAGRVDLREHARAFLSRRLARGTSRAGGADASLVLSALVSVLWLGFVTQALIARGPSWVLGLLDVAAQTEDARRYIAFAGAGLLAAAIPIVLVVLAFALGRSIRALIPREPRPSPTTSSIVQPVELAAIPLFSRLDDEDVRALADASEHRTYTPGEAVVTQGEAGDVFFAVRAGQLSVELVDGEGVRREVAQLGPGDCFGERALLDGDVRGATVRAQSNVTVVALSKSAFEKVRAGLDAQQVTSLLRASAALRRNPLFGRLSADRRAALALRLRSRKLRADEEVVRAGQAGHEFFFVNEGSVEVVGDDGAALATLGPGDHFGEVALLRDVPRTATVRALTPAVVLSLDKESFLAAMAADLALSTELETVAAARAPAAEARRAS